MGLDAIVRCNCFESGRTTEPPFPREWVYIDEEGYCNLLSEYDTDENWPKFSEWRQSCCEHEDMDYASERISNWSGYRAFQEALERVGLEQFPVLAEELPNANGGLMSPESSALALKELEIFQNTETVGANAFLVDTQTGFEIFEHIAAYEGIFIMAGSVGIDVGIGEFEFFIRDRELETDLFRATRIEQTLLDPRNQDGSYNGDVEFRNLDTDETYTTSITIHGKQIARPDGQMQNEQGQVRFDYPERFHVEVRDVAPSEFEYILKPLATVFRASVETGNPVQWC